MEQNSSKNSKMYLVNFRFLEFLLEKKEEFHLWTITFKSLTMLAHLTAMMAVSGFLLLCVWVISLKSDHGFNKTRGSKRHSEKLLFVFKTSLLVFPF